MDIVDVILVARQRGRLDLLHHLQAAPGCAEWSSHRIGALGSALVLTVGDFCWNGAQVTARVCPTAHLPDLQLSVMRLEREEVLRRQVRAAGYSWVCSTVLSGPQQYSRRVSQVLAWHPCVQGDRVEGMPALEGGGCGRVVGQRSRLIALLRAHKYWRCPRSTAAKQLRTADSALNASE